MEVLIQSVLFLSSLASSVTRTTPGGNWNTYDEIHENKLTIKPNYVSNKFDDFLKFEVKQTQREENVVHKTYLNKYILFGTDDDNDSPQFIEKIPFHVIDGNAAKKTIDNESKLRQQLYTQCLNDSQHIEQLTNNLNSSTINMLYNRKNGGSNAFYHQSFATKYLYPIENLRSRKLRRSNKHSNKNISYQSLCPIKRTSVSLETIQFEYRPNHYIEVSCAHNYTPSYTNIDDKNKICSEAGFSCMQLNRTMYLIRRNKTGANECWESEVRVVPSGCECMWPKHYYGDILAYHETHKRYSTGSINGYIPHISKNNS